MPDRLVPDDPEPFAPLARAAGFEVLELTSAYEGQDLVELRLTAFDYHLNAKGHRVLGDRRDDRVAAELPQWQSTDASP